jgi:acrylyl-CoA reductase (NADPH)|tara:strand:- start:16323 stop:17423 length:1101 start_codon:yes stop_codon:yes gene_type:complete
MPTKEIRPPQKNGWFSFSFFFLNAPYNGGINIKGYPMEKFRALRLHQTDTNTPDVRIEELSGDSLSIGNVLIINEYSSLNYKDALAITGEGRIIREFPMIPGIDAAGVVSESDDPNFNVGEHVILTGHGVGETHTGGMSERVRVPGSYLVKTPRSLDSRRAMQFGTGGLTGMLCVLAILDSDLKPADGPIAVSGAGGGVGGIATTVLSTLGYEVHAITGRASEHARLRELGAVDILSREDFSRDSKPLESTRFAGAIDTVGGQVLSTLITQTRYNGVIAATGNAGGFKLNTTVFPFILRNIRLQGVDSVHAPTQTRERAWQLLSENVTIEQIDSITATIGLLEVEKMAEKLIKNQISGRILIDVQN